MSTVQNRLIFRITKAASLENFGLMHLLVKWSREGLHQQRLYVKSSREDVTPASE